MRVPPYSVFMAATVKVSKCFLCRVHPALTFEGEGAGVVQDWTKDWGTSLLAILEFGPEELHLEQTLNIASLCVNCQDTISNAEFTLRTIEKLQLELQYTKNHIRELLFSGGHRPPLVLQNGIVTDMELVEGPGTLNSSLIQNDIPTVEFKVRAKKKSRDQEERGGNLISPRLLKQQRQESTKGASSRAGQRVQLRHSPAHDTDEDDDGQDVSPDYEPVPQDLGDEEWRENKVAKKPKRISTARSRRKSTPKTSSEIKIGGRNSILRPTRSPKSKIEGKKLDILAVVAKLQAETQELTIIRPVRKIKQEKMTVCPECEESFLTYSEYSYHYRREHSELSFKSRLASGESPNDNQIPGQLNTLPSSTAPIPVISGKLNTICPKCSKVMKAFHVPLHLKYSCRSAGIHVQGTSPDSKNVTL